MSHSGPGSLEKLEHNDSEAMQQLVLSAPEQRLKLMGNVTQALHLYEFIQELLGHEEVTAEESHEELSNYPDIDNILSNTQNLKQIVFTVSQNEPGLFDYFHPEAAHEHLHANIATLNKTLEIYLFLEKYVNDSLEHTEIFGHINLNILDKYVNLFQHCSRFGMQQPFDAEQRETHTSIFEKLEYIDSACEVFESCRGILNAALEDDNAIEGSKNKILQPFLWSIYKGAINSYHAHFLVAHQLKDSNMLEVSLANFNEVTEYVSKNIKNICQYANQDIADSIQELVQYKKHIKKLSSISIEMTLIEHVMKKMYDLLGEMYLTNGIREPENTTLIDKPTLESIIEDVKIISKHVECMSIPEDVVEVFSRHIQMVCSIYHQEPSLHEILAANILMRTWIKWLAINMPQVKVRYLELTYESIYLINCSLRSKLSDNISSEFLDRVTNSIEEFERALKLKDYSIDSLVRWINKSEVKTKESLGDKPKKKNTKKNKRLKKKKPAFHSAPISSRSNKVSVKKEPAQANDLCLALDNMQLNDPCESDRSDLPWTIVKNRKKRKGASSNAFNEVALKQEDSFTNEVFSKEKDAPVVASISAVDKNEVAIKQEESSTNEVFSKEKDIPVAASISAVDKDESILLECESQEGILNVKKEQYPVSAMLGLKIPEPVMEVMLRLENSGHASYIYGGYVRDDMHKKPYNDIDLVADCGEAIFLKLFPKARKEKMLHHKTVYHIDQTISVTLRPDLNLSEFCQERFLAANALVANKRGEILDPLGVMALAMADKLTPMPTQSIIAMYKADPSRMFRTIRYATHLQKFWNKDIYQGMMVCGKMINRMPFGQFLCHFGELFLRGAGELHLHLFLNLGMLPHVCLPLGSDWAKYISEKSILFHFMKYELAQIDRVPVKQRTTQNRLYLLTLFLLPALEKIRLIDEGIEGTYTGLNIECSVDKILEQFFLLYEGDIQEENKKSHSHQMKALILQVIWPKFLYYRDYFIQKNYYLSVMQAPPRYFYEPIMDNHNHLATASNLPQSATPMYHAYVKGGTTYYNISQQQTDEHKSSLKM